MFLISSTPGLKCEELLCVFCLQELERYVQNLEKNHKHELGIERARQKDFQKQMSQLREDNERLQSSIKVC